MIKARACRFGSHISGRIFERDENADCRRFSGNCADQIADAAGFDFAGFDLHENALCLARIVVNEIYHAVNAFVRTFLARFAARRRAQRATTPTIEIDSGLRARSARLTVNLQVRRRPRNPSFRLN